MPGHKYTNNTFIVMDTHQRIKKSFLKQPHPARPVPIVSTHMFREID